MSGELLGIAFAVLIQAFAAIWWAARITAQLAALSVEVSKLAVHVSALSALVAHHEVSLQVLAARYEQKG